MKIGKFLGETSLEGKVWFFWGFFWWVRSLCDFLIVKDIMKENLFAAQSYTNFKSTRNKTAFVFGKVC